MQNINYIVAMHLFFFDTETNGLPRNYRAPPTQIGNWPEIISIAWEAWTIQDGVWSRDRSESYLVQPSEGLIWDKGAEHIHGISYVKALTEGQSIKTILEKVQEEFSKATHILSHNLAFDKSVVLASMFRHTGTAKWPAGVKDVCTMLATVSICKIKSTSPYATELEPYKWPRLQELHHFLFASDWPGPAHEALSDVQCMVACYRALVERGLLTV